MVTEPSKDERRRRKLEGIRVLDATGVLAGPYCTALLGDLGADVIKVEQMSGDVARQVWPARNKGMSGSFLTLNRNKRSVAFDLSKPRGLKCLLDIARTCDVFVCNLRPDAIVKLGISYKDIAASSPNIIYCRLSGWGREHKDHDSPAYDDIIQAASGLVDLLEKSTGAPRYVPMSIVDTVTGMMAAIAILAALSRTAIAGGGEEIDVSMYDTMASLVLTSHISGAAFDPPLGPPLATRSVLRSRHPLKTKGGSISVLPYTDEHWKRFFAAVGRKDLAESPEYRDMSSRSKNFERLHEDIEGALMEGETDQWIETFKSLGIPCSIVQSTMDLVEMPELYEAGVLHRMTHPTEGETMVVGNPIRYGRARSEVPAPAPHHGQHTREVLKEIGYGDDDVGELFAAGVAK